ncbi:unnamed protein product [Orchesella dallaii]|uniref:Uncharacterized protein n=1 Tax=Orchesella dallaii TaxID=48710 RepID=A0ABP1PWW4_9HEXA
MGSHEQLVSEVERVMAALKENMPKLHRLTEQDHAFYKRWKEFGKIKLPEAGMSNPHSMFKELRLRSAEILNAEKELYVRFCRFSNTLDEALKTYEYVEKRMRHLHRQDPGFQRDETGAEFTRLRKLFAEDEKFAEFRNLNVEQLEDAWKELNLGNQLHACAQHMEAVKVEMICKLGSVPTNYN